MCHVLVGILLIAAAGMKYFTADRLNVLIPVEAIIGAGLIMSLSRRVFVPAALTLFAAFAGYNVYAIFSGSSSCDCLGAITGSPLLMLAVDLLAVVLLIFQRRCHDRSISFNAVMVIGIIATMCVLPWLERQDVTTARTIDLGSDCLVGTVKRFSIEVNNTSNAIVNVVGGTADCSCAAVGPFPRKIMPGEKASIAVSIAHKEAGAFTRRIVLFTDAVPANLTVKISGVAVLGEDGR